MPAVKGDGMRGLAVFISDIRNCKSKEAEVKRINKELANIRSKFKGDKTLDGYQKKKYVCKLLFIFLLGHDIDFGHMEAVNLLSSNKYTEKQIGYLFISVLLGASSDLMKLVIQSLKNDITSRNPIHVNLALHCIANIGSKEMAEAFGKDIPKLLVSGDTLNEVKQSSALCLLKLIRTSPDVVPMTEWASRVIHLLNDQHMGVVTSACSLIELLSRKSPDDYKGCVALGVSRLSRIVTSSYTDLQDYSYYFVPAPWLCVKLLRLLQNYPSPEDATVKNRLTECLENILNRAQEAPKVKKVQHPNAKNAVLFEAINLIIHMDCEPDLLVRACNQLGQFLQHRETNLRYLALESMCLLATSEFSHDAVKKHQETVVNSLKTERDVSVRQRAVDLLYAMCDRSNAEEIVSEMLTYLETADYSIREEMVLKVAILAEKYAVDYTWYVDVILNLIRMAGDYVSEEVWYRVIQIVINRDDVQGYAAKTVFEALQAPACHENMVKVGGYILGEFGNLIAGDARSSPMIQFQLLHSKFHLCSLQTRQLLLSTYIKFINLFPEIKHEIQNVLKHDNQLKNSDVELQQRAAEYLHLSSVTSTDVLAMVLEEMPPFPERDSSILAKLKKKKPATADIEAQENKDKTATKISRPTAAAAAAAPEGLARIPPLEINTSAAAAGGDNKVTSDLLNLSTPPVNAGPASNTDMLADILGLGDLGGESNTDPVNAGIGSLLNGGGGPSPPTLGGNFDAPQDNYKKFVCKNTGVLYESDLIQIGVKSEFRQNLGRISLYFGNKTSSVLSGFNIEVDVPSPLNQQVNLTFQPVTSVISAGEQQLQVVNIECITDFCDLPTLNVQFMYSGAQQHFSVKLPLLINKFLEPTEMDSAVFFRRWNALSAPEQQCQVKFNTSQDNEMAKNKLLGFGASLLANVDPNPQNYVMAGIVHTKMAQIGGLLRLEYDRNAQMYRLTVRASKDVVAVRLCELLQTQLL